jgi:hypothetical protein
MPKFKWFKRTKPEPKEVKNCTNCRFNNEEIGCFVGTYYAAKGLKAICYQGELWEANIK